MIRRAAAAILCALATAAGAQVPEPEGYRMEEYRAPVPGTLEGGTVADPQQAHALWEAGETAFVDALPWTPRPKNLPEGTIWREKPRDSIPGAIWLANTGYGDLAPEMHAYFLSGLEDVTEGDRDHKVLFFCLAECWMSWNAAKRTISDGYTEVYWMPQGTDGWAEAGYPLERVNPYPGHP